MPATAATGVEYELFDVAKQQRLLGFAMTARGDAMRDVAHQIADAIYEKILGVRGAFWTRIAYVTASGLGNERRYALMVADADGYNPQTVVRSARSRCCRRRGARTARKLAYVSFDRGNSSIYIQDIAHQRARAGRELPRHQRRAGVLARWPTAGADAVQERQSRDLRDGPGQQGAAPDHQPVRHRHRSGVERRTAAACISRPIAAASRRSTRCRPAAAAPRA